MSDFRFEPCQIENLENFKRRLETAKASAHTIAEEKAEVETSKVLNSEGFIRGENLSAEQLDGLFNTMRKFAANRNLTKRLYESDIAAFNGKLRNLIHGTSPFPVRVNDFFRQKGIGVQTLSQFLVAHDPRNHPFVSSGPKEMLEISSEQEQAARNEALRIFKINDPKIFFDRTLDYLAYCIVFKSIKELLNLEKYTQVNKMLWFAYDAESKVPDTITPYGSIHMEQDLQNFLADNIFLVEKGLHSVEKEFDTREAGRIDLLCKDKSGDHVVIELKRGKENDCVVGQTLRYVGWVEKNLKTKARGIIIVNEADASLEYALGPIKSTVALKFYKANFEIKERP